MGPAAASGEIRIRFSRQGAFVLRAQDTTLHRFGAVEYRAPGTRVYDDQELGSAAPGLGKHLVD